MKYIVSNIEYDTDGENVDLPGQIEIEVPDEIKEYGEIEQYVSDAISDITGFCHKGFSTTPEIYPTIMDDEFQYDLPDDPYGLFIVSSDDDTPEDPDDFGYDWVRDRAIDSYRAESKEELLNYLIDGLNDQTISDYNWIFLVDLKEETIISRIPFGF